MKIGILGYAGRMGRTVAQEALQTPGIELIGGTIRGGNPATDEKLTLTSDPAQIACLVDVLIDFTHPEALPNHLRIAAEAKTPLVICTTGLTAEHQQMVGQHALEIPIVLAPNTSVGVALLSAAVDFIARRLDSSYDIEIFEMHHRHKLDAPSGTAIALGQVATRARGQTLKAEDCLPRTSKRQEGEVGFSVARGGGICGDVKVMFVDDNEMLELSHRALNRALFAKGALKAAQWVCQAKPGLYGMQDVLRISKL